MDKYKYRCAGNTRKGKRCKNKALDTDFCWLHSNELDSQNIIEELKKDNAERERTLKEETLLRESIIIIEERKKERKKSKKMLEQADIIHSSQLAHKNKQLEQLRIELKEKKRIELRKNSDLINSNNNSRRKIKNRSILILFLQISLYVTSLIVYFGMGLETVATSFILFVVALDFFLIFNLVAAITKVQSIKFSLGVYFISTAFMVLSFSLLYMKSGVFVEDYTKINDFWSCLYFSVITWTSLGYGDIFPTFESRKWVMTEVFLGYVHMGILVGLLLEYVTKGKKS